MARATKQFNRIYVEGRDLSCSTIDLGAVGDEYETDNLAAWCDEVRGALPGAPTVTIGTLTGYLDNTANRLHALFSAPGAVHLAIAIGGTAIPAAGAHVFMARALVRDYKLGPGDVMTTTTANFDNCSDGLNIANPFGALLHANGAETGANAGTGVDAGAATTAGAWMMYHILAVSGSGSATITVEDSADNTTFSAVSGLTSGAIAHSAMPCAGFSQTATGATIKRYTRWQLSLTGITSITFVLALARGKA